MCAQLLSHVQLFATPWTVAHQAPLSMEFSRLEYWSRLWFPIPGGSFQSRDQTHVSFISCIGRWILHHWATWKPSSLCILCQIILSYWVANLLEDPISSIYAKWSESRSVVSDSLPPHWLYSSWNSLGQNTGVSRLSLLQGIFPTQGWNPGLPHCRRILYQLSHKGSPNQLSYQGSPQYTPISSWIQSFFSSLQAGSMAPGAWNGRETWLVVEACSGVCVCVCVCVCVWWFWF